MYFLQLMNGNDKRTRKGSRSLGHHRDASHGLDLESKVPGKNKNKRTSGMDKLCRFDKDTGLDLFLIMQLMNVFEGVTFHE